MFSFFTSIIYIYLYVPDVYLPYVSDRTLSVFYIILFHIECLHSFVKGVSTHPENLYGIQRGSTSLLFNLLIAQIFSPALLQQCCCLPAYTVESHSINLIGFVIW
uniref:Uncharacterized protein n=1 Tax=Siphoviridae sp. ctbxa26 TaxID=2825568 RepID=A0A8S5VFA3_9CAUD|nr:MAG TPA: hypothetical protein [Siphoviridae sp. ctbxa26]